VDYGLFIGWGLGYALGAGTTSPAWPWWKRGSRSPLKDVMHDSEMIAQELSALGHRLEEIEKRLAAVENVNTRLEQAALTTARAMEEISSHWDAVYEAMRRRDESQQAAEH
jgi:uncharacterized coiled-coil protein SlyX